MLGMGFLVLPAYSKPPAFDLSVPPFPNVPSNAQAPPRDPTEPALPGRRNGPRQGARGAKCATPGGEPDQTSLRTLLKTFQKAASCEVAKLIRIMVLGGRRAWKSDPGASR